MDEIIWSELSVMATKAKLKDVLCGAKSREEVTNRLEKAGYPYRNISYTETRRSGLFIAMVGVWHRSGMDMTIHI